jgi:hypothetical protein
LLYHHSRFGSGKLLSNEEINKSLLICHDVGEKTIQERLEDGEAPPAPMYTLI